MVHEGQRLPLRLEPGDDLPRVHAGFDDLECDLALDGVRLLGHEYGAHAAFADLLQELVRADHGAGTLGDWIIDGGTDPLTPGPSPPRGRGEIGGGRFEEATG